MVCIMSSLCAALLVASAVCCLGALRVELVFRLLWIAFVVVVEAGGMQVLLVWLFWELQVVSCVGLLLSML